MSVTIRRYIPHNVSIVVCGVVKNGGGIKNSPQFISFFPFLFSQIALIEVGILLKFWLADKLKKI